MARDYASQSKPIRAVVTPNKIRLVKIVMAFIVMLFITGWLILKFHDKSAKPIKLNLVKTTGLHPLVKKQQSDTKKLTEPRFDFYTLLPKMKVWVPKQNDTALPSKIKVPMVYLLQVAALHKLSDAKLLQAKLQAKGYNVSIKKSSNWNIVFVGPYPHEYQAFHSQVKLAEEDHIQAIVLQSKKVRLPQSQIPSLASAKLLMP